jgi:sporulation protein YlmC with PRC-barrel domain
MAHHADEHERTAHPAAVPKLVKLSDSAGFRLEDGVLDVRGLGVFTRDGEQMGTVEDLYVDTVEREVRFLDVSAGGFLGLGEKHFLIPVEAVAEIYDDGVTVDQNREKISESLSLNTKVVPHTRL